jgi:hypothetical protein
MLNKSSWRDTTPVDISIIRILHMRGVLLAEAVAYFHNCFLGCVT